MGRPPKPNALKKLSGTDQPCRMNANPEFQKVVKVPPPPTYLSKFGKKAYKITSHQLAALGLLSEINIPLVVMYANELGNYWEAQEDLSVNGRYDTVVDKMGNKRKLRKDLDKAASNYFENVKKLAVELGITPASAGRIKMPEKKSSNPFDNF